jgi:hypothetical protein
MSEGRYWKFFRAIEELFTARLYVGALEKEKKENK